MLGKVLVFALIVLVALAVFGRGARRAEQAQRGERKPPADAARPSRPAPAQDLTPCPRCGAYVADPESCDCRERGDPPQTDMQQ